MDVKIKKLHPDAVIPKYAMQGDAGLDLVATEKWMDADGNICYGTGLAFEISEGYVGLLFPRSSNSRKSLILSNSVGLLDSSYRGQVVFKFKPSLKTYQLNGDKEHLSRTSTYFYKGENYEVGDRIGQILILPYPQINFIESDTLSETDRGDGGFGSTGN